MDIPITTELNPDFPVVVGHYQLTQGWHVELPQPFNRRIDDGSLVLWMPELTFWINIWHNDRQASVEQLLADATRQLSPLRRDEQLVQAGGMTRLTYELTEADDEPDAPDTTSINASLVAPAGLLQLSAYADSPAARDLAYQIIASVSAAE